MFVRLESLNDSLGVACDKQLFVGGNNPNLNLGAFLGDAALFTAACVSFLIKVDAEEAELGEYALTYVIVVLADTAGEANSVKTTECSSVEADVSDTVKRLMK